MQRHVWFGLNTWPLVLYDSLSHVFHEVMMKNNLGA